MSQTPQPRIGHAEREQAAERLRVAAGQGRIDLDELDERLEVALSARTQTELDALLSDLGLITGALATPAAGGVAVPPEPGHQPGDPLTLSAGAGSVRKDGAWEVPGWIRISPTLGSVHLDCRHASTRYAAIDVEVVASVGSVVIVLPPGWAANTDRLGRGVGSVTSRVPSRPEPGHPVLVLRGSTGVGSVKIRHANRWDRWRSGE